MKNKGELLFNIFVLVIICGFVFLSIGYSPEARLVPLIVGIFGIIFMGFQLISIHPRFSNKLEKLSSRRDWFHKDEIMKKKIDLQETEAKQTTLIQKDVPQSVKVMFLWVVIFGATIFLFGFLLAVPILIFVYLKYIARASMLFSASSAVGVELVMYFVFVYFLHVILYKGYIFILIAGR